MSSFVIRCCSHDCRERLAWHKVKGAAAMERNAKRAFDLGWKRGRDARWNRLVWDWACPRHSLPARTIRRAFPTHHSFAPPMPVEALAAVLGLAKTRPPTFKTHLLGTDTIIIGEPEDAPNV